MNCQYQCKAKEGSVKCVDASDQDLRFECSVKGEFPDPKHCNRTYICNSDTGSPAEMCECPPGHFVYPEQGLFCVPEPCPVADITCKNGKFGHFELENGLKTSFYYYCKADDVVTVYKDVEVENRLLRTAQYGKQAVVATIRDGKECVRLQASTSISTPPTTTPSTITPSTTTPPTSTPPTAHPPIYLPPCRRPWQKFPAECDCSYYLCNRYLQPVRRTCHVGRRYCAMLNLCIFGKCDESKCRIPKHVH